MPENDLDRCRRRLADNVCRRIFGCFYVFTCFRVFSALESSQKLIFARRSWEQPVPSEQNIDIDNMICEILFLLYSHVLYRILLYLILHSLRFDMFIC